MPVKKTLCSVHAFAYLFNYANAILVFFPFADFKLNAFVQRVYLCTFVQINNLKNYNLTRFMQFVL